MRISRVELAILPATIIVATIDATISFRSASNNFFVGDRGQSALAKLFLLQELGYALPDFFWFLIWTPMATFEYLYGQVWQQPSVPRQVNRVSQTYRVAGTADEQHRQLNFQYFRL